MVTLERLADHHKEALAQLGNDPLISVSSSVDHPCTVNTVQSWMDEGSGDPPRRITFVVWVDGEMVGAMSLKQIDYVAETAEVSYWVGRPFWGRGIAKMALDAIIDVGFNQMNFNSLQAFCLRDNNQPSLR
ncbi:N-acetyltransferase, partial [bacterium]